MTQGRTSAEMQALQRETLKAWLAMKTETGALELWASWTPLEVSWRAYLIYCGNLRSVPFSQAKWRKELAEQGVEPSRVLNTLCLPLRVGLFAPA